MKEKKIKVFKLYLTQRKSNIKKWILIGKLDLRVSYIDRTSGGARAAESLLSLSQSNSKVFQSSTDPAVLNLLIRQEELRLQGDCEQRAHELELARLNAEQERMRLEKEIDNIQLVPQVQGSVICKYLRVSNCLSIKKGKILMYSSEHLRS